MDDHIAVKFDISAAQVDISEQLMHRKDIHTVVHLRDLAADGCLIGNTIFHPLKTGAP